jgi:hypothetical protein
VAEPYIRRCIDGFVGRRRSQRFSRHLEDDPPRFSHLCDTPQAPMTT